MAKGNPRLALVQGGQGPSEREEAGWGGFITLKYALPAWEERDIQQEEGDRWLDGRLKPLGSGLVKTLPLLSLAGRTLRITTEDLGLNPQRLVQP